MPRDDQKIIRSPSFKSKLSSITGMSSDEKALVIRIGNLIDFIVETQRQESNPRGRSRKRSTRVPTPQNVTGTAIAGGISVDWDPIDFSGLSFYEIQYDTNSVFSNPNSFQNIDTRFVIKTDINQTIYIRVRAVSKQGEVSGWSSTSNVLQLSTTIDLDFDHVNFENRTTVEPKPTLSSSDLEITLGDTVFVGVGGIVGGSPLTLTDSHIGFPTTNNRKNEINYTLVEADDECTVFEQKVMGLPDDFIEQSDFYLYEADGATGQAFYYSTFIYPGSFVDFFQGATPVFDPTQMEVEFLRYRLVGSFYQPNFPQTGTVFSGNMALLKV